MSTFNLTGLSMEQVNALLTGLGELPLKVSLDVFGVVRGQIDQQLQAAQAPAQPEATPKAAPVIEDQQGPAPEDQG